MWTPAEHLAIERMTEAARCWHALRAAGAPPRERRRYIQRILDIGAHHNIHVTASLLEQLFNLDAPNALLVMEHQEPIATP